MHERATMYYIHPKYTQTHKHTLCKKIHYPSILDLNIACVCARKKKLLSITMILSSQQQQTVKKKSKSRHLIWFNQMFRVFLHTHISLFLNYVFNQFIFYHHHNFKHTNTHTHTQTRNSYPF